jgi:hypothetical protein
LITACLLLSPSRYLCWWIISARGYHPPSRQCVGTDMVYKIYLLLKFTSGIGDRLLAPKTLKIIWLSNLSILNVPGEGYSKKRVVSTKFDICVFISCSRFCVIYHTVLLIQISNIAPSGTWYFGNNYESSYKYRCFNCSTDKSTTKWTFS